jgi:DNA-directed RNA polymerase subunit H
MEEKIKFDITQHHLVPKHEVINKEEKKKVLEKLNISLKQLPFILSTDPLVKHLNAKVDDVIKITRKSATAGETIYYRVVIHG